MTIVELSSLCLLLQRVVKISRLESPKSVWVRLTKLVTCFTVQVTISKRFPNKDKLVPNMLGSDATCEAAPVVRSTPGYLRFGFRYEEFIFPIS